MLTRLALALAVVIPIHGTVLAHGPNGTVIIRSDPVTGMLPAQTRAYRLSPNLAVSPGVGIDGFVDRRKLPWRWYDAAIAARFVPGLPETGKVIPIDYGSALPATQLVDQNGRLVNLATAFPGRVRIISFIFTRCPDRNECPALSAKFAILARQLDPKRFHLIEITLDPRYDSPWVLHRYAKQFGAKSSSWSILSGQPHEIGHLLNRFGISSMQVSDANFIHNDRVFITDPKGRVAGIVSTIGFAPSALAAQARHIAGLAASPLGRFELSLVASVTSLCGGSQYAGIVLLETVLLLIIAVLSFISLGWIARRIWGND